MPTFESVEHGNKLLPLRYFAKKGPYSTAYLSLLVQRKKLRAEKRGRNFYTTQDWFNEYLILYGRKEEKKYQNNRESGQDWLGFFVVNFKKYSLIFLGIILIFMFSYIYILLNSIVKESGRVAGIEEKIGMKIIPEIKINNFK